MSADKPLAGQLALDGTGVRDVPRPVADNKDDIVAVFRGGTWYGPDGKSVYTPTVADELAPLIGGAYVVSPPPQELPRVDAPSLPPLSGQPMDTPPEKPGDHVYTWASIMFQRAKALGIERPVFELRMLKTRKGTISGYFDNGESLTKTVLAQDEAGREAIYATLNPVAPDLLARATNRVVEWSKFTTDDASVSRRIFLPFDFDPDRPAGISSTDAEHYAAIDRARRVRNFLVGELGFPEPVIADSGNGGHLVFGIDLPNDADSLNLINTCLQAVAAKFGDEKRNSADAELRQVSDTTCGNAARIWKFYGSHARKGDTTAARPHRVARILSSPVTLATVPREKLERLAALKSSATSKAKAGTPKKSTRYEPDLDVVAWLETHNLVITKTKPYGDDGKGILYELECCPMDPAHNNGAACVIKFADGTVTAKCHHNGCSGKGWRDWREKVSDPAPAPEPTPQPPPVTFADILAQIEAFPELAGKTKAEIAANRAGRMPDVLRILELLVDQNEIDRETACERITERFRVSKVVLGRELKTIIEKRKQEADARAEQQKQADDARQQQEEEEEARQQQGADRKPKIFGYDGPAGRFDAISPDVRYAIVGDQLCTLQPRVIEDKMTGRTHHMRDGQGNPLYESDPLCNFAALISEELALDDGAELVRQFAIVGALSGGAALPEIRVPAADFEAMRWAIAHWGARASLNPGLGSKDKARAACQAMSSPKQRRVYTHSGWRQLDDGHRVYLHAGGAVGAEDVHVELQGKLANFVLPPADPEISTKDAVAVSHSILDVAPHAVTVPLLACTYLAPLASILPPDFLLWMVGRTGSMKSTLATLAQQHFGAAFSRTSLPVDWLSTGTSIESVLFTMKDAVCVIDDFAPQSDRVRQQKMEGGAQWMIRSIGNRSSRSRSRHDLTQRPDRPPRGVVISTAEDLPPGHSTIGRLVIVKVEREKIAIKKLSTVQARSSKLVHAMREYVQYVAGNYDKLAVEVPRIHAEYVAELRKANHAHARQPEALGFILTGIELFGRFAKSVGVLDDAGMVTLKADALAAVGEIGKLQDKAIEEADPCERYLGALRSMLATKKVRLMPKNGAAPKEEQMIDPIGWRDQECAYLDPDAARQAVVQFWQRAGESFVTSKRALHEQLERKGYIESKKEGTETRYEVQVKCQGVRQRVLQIPISKLFDKSPDQTTLPIK